MILALAEKLLTPALCGFAIFALGYAVGSGVMYRALRGGKR